jgi:hypothetical protein
VSTPTGPTTAGKTIVDAGIALAIVYAAWIKFGKKPAPTTA